MTNKFGTRYAPRPSEGLTFTKSTHTQQHFKDDCDINNIMNKFMKTGVIPQLQPSSFNFVDAGESLTYHEAMTFVAQAQEDFYDLPAHLRKLFDNDPGKMLAFVEDAENYEQAIALGLIAKPEASTIEDDEVPPVPLLDVTGGTDTKEEQILICVS